MREQNEAGYYLMTELQGRVELAADYPGYEHFHPFWELLWADAPVRLSWQGGSRSTRAALVPAGLVHRVAGDGRPCRLLYIGFRFPDGSLPQGERLSPLPVRLPTLDAAAEELLALPTQDFFAARGEVLTLLAEVLQQLPLSQPPGGRSSALAEKIRQLCGPYCHYTVRQMAGMLYLTPNHISDVFRAETGLRIKEYQTLVRMEEALRLLVSTAQPVAEIAARLGYANPSYFIRCFEQRYHCTPGAIRQAGGMPAVGAQRAQKCKEHTVL